ncbi:hypothetical protein K461DRAFT_293747 [Myriangium duriaei CBS 260.36]|uniref:Ubiquitin-like protease family profile domain-containing protein n=1 Tax=Myriangium duriaei CBS 260.36 TaxID=1168546 RepID=A0A9P4J3M9_9PEZI|nr:hypothetical protein K461DRAFT_293747 [Myriangium duriaei CBS 260.36]
MLGTLVHEVCETLQPRTDRQPSVDSSLNPTFPPRHPRDLPRRQSYLWSEIAFDHRNSLASNHVRPRIYQARENEPSEHTNIVIVLTNTPEKGGKTRIIDRSCRRNDERGSFRAVGTRQSEMSGQRPGKLPAPFKPRNTLGQKSIGPSTNNAQTYAHKSPRARLDPLRVPRTTDPPRTLQFSPSYDRDSDHVDVRASKRAKIFHSSPIAHGQGDELIEITADETDSSFPMDGRRAGASADPRAREWLGSFVDQSSSRPSGTTNDDHVTFSARQTQPKKEAARYLQAINIDHDVPPPTTSHPKGTEPVFDMTRSVEEISDFFGSRHNVQNQARAKTTIRHNAQSSTKLENPIHKSVDTSKSAKAFASVASSRKQETEQVTSRFFKTSSACPTRLRDRMQDSTVALNLSRKQKAVVRKPSEDELNGPTTITSPIPGGSAVFPINRNQTSNSKVPRPSKRNRRNRSHTPELSDYVSDSEPENNVKQSKQITRVSSDETATKAKGIMSEFTSRRSELLEQTTHKRSIQDTGRDRSRPPVDGGGSAFSAAAVPDIRDQDGRLKRKRNTQITELQPAEPILDNITLARSVTPSHEIDPAVVAAKNKAPALELEEENVRPADALCGKPAQMVSAGKAVDVVLSHTPALQDIKHDTTRPPTNEKSVSHPIAGGTEQQDEISFRPAESGGTTRSAVETHPVSKGIKIVETNPQSKSRRYVADVLAGRNRGLFHNDRRAPTEETISSSGDDATATYDLLGNSAAPLALGQNQSQGEHEDTEESVKEWREPLIWPFDDSKKVTVTFEDLHRLGDEEFLNDSIVSFCLRRLELDHKETSKTAYFFNTYFYETLTKVPRGRGGPINYDAVKNWTRRIDLFSYDYIIIPVNKNFHWYLLIVANVPALVKPIGVEEDEEDNLQAKTSPSGRNIIDISSSTADGRANKPGISPMVSDLEIHKMSLDNKEVEAEPTSSAIESHSHGVFKVPESDDDRAVKRPKKRRRGAVLRPQDPIVIALDSMGGEHTLEIRNVKKYLIEEASERRSITLQLRDFNGTTAKGIPTQTNAWDCGIFLIGYVDEFLKHPREFVEKVCNREMEETNSFRNFDASQQRNIIRRDIIKLEKEQKKRRIAANKEKKTQKNKENGKGEVIQQGNAVDSAEVDILPGRNDASSIQDEDEDEDSDDVQSRDDAASVVEVSATQSDNEAEPSLSMGDQTSQTIVPSSIDRPAREEQQINSIADKRSNFILGGIEEYAGG